MKTTLKKERATRQRTVKEHVLHLLNMSEEEYNKLMFEAACTYIEELAQVPEIAQEFLSEQLFWNWWKQQWAMVDEVFLLQSAQSPLTLPTIRNWYTRMHSDIDSFPDPVIYEQIQENYMKMASKIIKKHTENGNYITA